MCYTNTAFRAVGATRLQRLRLQHLRLLYHEITSNVFTFALYNFHPYYDLLVFAFGGLWRPNRIIGHLKATSLATLATLVALAALFSNLLVFDLHNFHSYYCLLGFASGGLWRPNRITGHLKAISLAVLAALSTLAALASLVPNVRSLKLWLLGGLPAPYIQNTLPTCSNMPYTTLILIIICFVWPLETSRDLWRPPEGKMSLIWGRPRPLETSGGL